MAMDSTAAARWSEQLAKERKFANRYRAENLARMEEPDEFPAPPPLPKSSSEHFLEQMSGMAKKNPFEMLREKAALRESNSALLYYGVSKAGEGRSGYLAARTAKGPQEKYGTPLTTSQLVGWYSPITPPVGSSPFANRPLVKSQFYRPMGAFGWKPTV
jgi:hypothetical protein